MYGKGGKLVQHASNPITRYLVPTKRPNDQVDPDSDLSGNPLNRRGLAQSSHAVDTDSDLHRAVDTASDLHRAVDTEDDLHRAVDTEDDLHRAVDTEDDLHRAVDTDDDLHPAVDTDSDLSAVDDE
jgi:hypothetical protein